MSHLTTQEFEFTTVSGETIRVRINGPALAAYILRKITQPGKGGKRRERLTRMEGAISARRLTR